MISQAYYWLINHKFSLQAWHKNPGERPSFQRIVELLNIAWNCEAVQNIARLQGVQPALSTTYRVSELNFCLVEKFILHFFTLLSANHFVGEPNYANWYTSLGFWQCSKS